MAQRLRRIRRDEHNGLHDPRERTIRLQRHESGRGTKPWSRDSPSHSMESAIETTLYAGCKDGTTLRLRAFKVARDGWRWQAGHKPRLTGSGRKDIGGALMNWLLKFGSQLRMEELRRVRELAEGKSQRANQTLVEKSSIPAPSIEIARVANVDPPHSQCTSRTPFHPLRSPDPRPPACRNSLSCTLSQVDLSTRLCARTCTRRSLTHLCELHRAHPEPRLLLYAHRPADNRQRPSRSSFAVRRHMLRSRNGLILQNDSRNGKSVGASRPTT